MAAATTGMGADRDRPGPVAGARNAWALLSTLPERSAPRIILRGHKSTADDLLTGSSSRSATSMTTNSTREGCCARTTSTPSPSARSARRLMETSSRWPTRPNLGVGLRQHALVAGHGRCGNATGGGRTQSRGGHELSLTAGRRRPCWSVTRKTKGWRFLTLPPDRARLSDYWSFANLSRRGNQHSQVSSFFKKEWRRFGPNPPMDTD